MLVPEGLDGGLVVDERQAFLVDRDGAAVGVDVRAALGDERFLDVGCLDAAHADRFAHLHHRDRRVPGHLRHPAEARVHLHRPPGITARPHAGRADGPHGRRDGGPRGPRRGKARPDPGDVHGRRHVAVNAPVQVDN